MSKVIDEYSKRNAKLVDGGLGEYMVEKSELFNSLLGSRKKVIDLGANHGAFTKFFTDKHDVTAVDFDRENLALVTKRMKAATIPFDLNEDISTLGVGKWDGVIMTEVLEHLYFPDKKVPEIAKLLKPDGVFLGSVPNGFSLINRIRYVLNKPEGTTMREPTHITHFSYTRLHAILSKNFGYVRICPIGKKRYAQLAALSPNFFGFDLAFECRKPKA